MFVLGKSTCVSELRDELVSFSWKTILVGKKLENKHWLFRLGDVVDILSKLNEMGLSFQGTQMIVLVANHKFELSKKSLNFGKLVSSTTKLTASQYTKTFLIRYVRAANMIFNISL